MVLKLSEMAMTVPVIAPQLGIDVAVTDEEQFTLFELNPSTLESARLNRELDDTATNSTVYYDNRMLVYVPSYARAFRATPSRNIRWTGLAVVERTKDAVDSSSSIFGWETASTIVSDFSKEQMAADVGLDPKLEVLMLFDQRARTILGSRRIKLKSARIREWSSVEDPEWRETVLDYLVETTSSAGLSVWDTLSDELEIFQRRHHLPDDALLSVTVRWE